jgi:hypothetical protein
VKPWPWLQPAEKAAPTAEQVLRRFRAKRSRAEGRRGEALVEHRLRALGIAMVERINVERLQVGGKALFKKRVSGDFRGIIPWTGRSVLVEVKLRPDTLSRSDLEKHQHAALWEHQCMGGLSLVAWVRGIDVFILTYKGFLADCSPGEPLTVEKARTLQITKPLANPT